MGTQRKVSALISDIHEGALILPEFQRGYIWTATQVREYLASLYRGYPTGSFLIWRTPRPGLVRGTIPHEAEGTFNLILDGQQRLTSVYALTTGNPPPFYEGERLYFDIHFNVRTEDFSYYKPTIMRGSMEWIPVTPFLRTGVGQYLQSYGPLPQTQREFLFNFFDKLQQLDSIKNYTYYLDSVDSRNMDEVVRIFNLVNSKGTRLSKSDLALSHLCALWPQARQLMREFITDIASFGFKFDLSFLVRCTASVATGAGYYEPLYRTPIETIQSAWNRTRQAIEYLVNVLKFDAYIDTASDLATDMVLVPMVAHIARNSGTFRSEAEKRGFLYWMYAALMWARYSGSAETKLHKDLEAENSDDPARKLIENLIAERGRLRVAGTDLAGKTSRSPFYRMSYIVARSRNARDWFTDALPLYSKSVGKSRGLEAHHIFPQSRLYKSQYYSSANTRDRNTVNEISNIAFLTRAANRKIANSLPSEYLPNLDTQRLREQSVPPISSLWPLDQYEPFLEHRREYLATSINEYMESLIDERKETYLSIEDYINQGETETLEFKSSLRWDYQNNRVNKELEEAVAKTIAGFMNSKGGTLIIGVRDDRTVTGLDRDMATLGKRRDTDGWEQALRNSLSRFLTKPIAALVSVSFSDANGSMVAIVSSESSLHPVYVKKDGQHEFYIRSGNTTQVLDVREANDYIKDHFQTSF